MKKLSLILLMMASLSACLHDTENKNPGVLLKTKATNDLIPLSKDSVECETSGIGVAGCWITTFCDNSNNLFTKNILSFDNVGNIKRTPVFYNDSNCSEATASVPTDSQANEIIATSLVYKNSITTETGISANVFSANETSEPEKTKNTIFNLNNIELCFADGTLTIENQQFGFKLFEDVPTRLDFTQCLTRLNLN